MTPRTPRQISDELGLLHCDLYKLTKWRDEILQAAADAGVELMVKSGVLGSDKLRAAILAIGNPHFREGELVRWKSGRLGVWSGDGCADEAKPVHVEIIDGRAIVREDAE